VPDNKINVLLKPENIKIQASPGANLLDVLGQAGINLSTACGGAGVCGSCKVRVLSGNVPGNISAFISPSELESGWRQACQCAVLSDAVIYVPPVSRPQAAPGQTLSLDLINHHLKIDPTVVKYPINLAFPSAEANASDLTRLLLYLEQEYNLRRVTVDLSALQRLPSLIRDPSGYFTATLMKESAGGHRLINLERGNGQHPWYALAFDLGTTTVWGQIVDMRTGQVMGQAIHSNEQAVYGQDVISRILFSQRDGGLARLTQATLSSLNRVLASLFEITRLNAEPLTHVVLAANTTMLHFLYGLNPQYIRLSPYVPVATSFPVVKAAALGLSLPPHVPIMVFPAISSWIGGDITAGLVASGMYRKKGTALYIDIGTNGETALGGADWLVSAACSAGPAFEGGGITCGMVAQDGAIEECKIDAATLEPSLRVIGQVRPRGICGSGLISALAGLFECEVLLANGKFKREARNPRLRRGILGIEYVLSWAAQNDTGKDIMLSEADIDNLLRAKAAIYAGYETLRQNVGISPDEIDRVYVTGGFGHHLDLENAITIGLLPDLPRYRFIFMGNGSLSGARLAVLSQNVLTAAAKTARRVTPLELAEQPDYMARYTAALFLPHTDAAYFPSVIRRLAKRM